MTTSAFQSGNPCEVLARVGFDSLLPFSRRALVDDPDDWDAHERAEIEDHRTVARLLLDSEAEPIAPYSQGIAWLGRRIIWPDRVPGLKTWAGRQSLPKLILARQAAMRGVEMPEESPLPPEPDAPKRKGRQPKAPLPRMQSIEKAVEQITNLYEFRAPLSGASGFDPSTARTSLEIGFSPNALGMSVVARPALELLAIIGLETLPLVSFSKRECGFILDGRLWRMPIEPRDGDYLFRWGQIVRPPEPILPTP